MYIIKVVFQNTHTRANIFGVKKNIQKKKKNQQSTLNTFLGAVNLKRALARFS